MKKLTLFTGIIMLAFASTVFARNADDIVGEWYTAEKNSVIEIYKCSDLYCGKIIWLKNPTTAEGKDKTDIKNPDETKRNRKIIGLEIMRGFRNNGENTWEDGKIYDPKTGNTYSCKMKLNGIELKVRGYIGFSLLGRTTVWTRK